MAYAKNTIKKFHVSLVAICFGLGMVLFTELNIDYSHNRTTTSSKIDITEEITIPVVNEDFPLLSDYQEIIDRPLFIQDRQPYVYEEPNEELNQTKAKEKAIQIKTSHAWQYKYVTGNTICFGVRNTSVIY